MVKDFWWYLRNDNPYIPNEFINALIIMCSEETLQGLGFIAITSQKYESLLMELSTRYWSYLFPTEVPPTTYSDATEILYSKVFKKSFVLKEYTKPIVIPPNTISIKIDEDLTANGMTFAYFPTQLQYILGRFPETTATFDEKELKQIILADSLTQLDIPITIDYPCSIPTTSILTDSKGLRFIQNEKMERLHILNISSEEDLSYLPSPIKVVTLDLDVMDTYLIDKNIKCLTVFSIPLKNIPKTLETLNVKNMSITIDKLLNMNPQLKLVASQLDKKVFIRNGVNALWEEYSND